MTITPQPGDKNGRQLPTIPDVGGLTLLDAALAFAAEGIYLLLVTIGKHAGSHAGKGWPAKSTCDSETITAWCTENPNAGIAIHTGRSGLVAFDLDVDVIPDELTWLKAGLFQSTRGGRGARGHYVFASAETFTSGNLRTTDDQHVGEIRSGNTVIMVQPSPHPRADDGGEYRWITTGVVPELPDEARAYLTTKAGGGGQPTSARNDAELTAHLSAYFEAHTTESQPWRRQTFRDHYAKLRGEGEAHHGAMMKVLGWTAREIEAGFVSATVFDDLRDDWRASFGPHDRNPPGDEFWRMACTAIDDAAKENPDDLRNRGHRDFGTDHRDYAGVFDRFEFIVENTSADDDGQDMPTDNAEQPSSWAPVDMAAALDNENDLTPTILARSDGAHLFYPGKVHSVHGESESGKTWLALCAAAECLNAGKSVLFVDFEDDAVSVGKRLLLLGVPQAVVVDAALFGYVRPEVEPKDGDELNAFGDLLSRQFTLAVIDGVTESMDLFGLSGKDNDDIATWHRKLPKAISRATGAAVVCVDHVTKDPGTRGRFALGGQHKMAGLDGAAFIIEPDKPFARGLAGEASVRVGKDRPGCLRGLGGRWRKSDRTQLVATFGLDSTAPAGITWTLDAPLDMNAAGHIDNSATGGPPARPKWCMEHVSRYWEMTTDLEKRSTRQTVDALYTLHKATGSKIGRDTWRHAVDVLVTEGYATWVAGKRNSHLHTSLRPYREATDPTPDNVSGVPMTSGSASNP